MYTFLFVSHFLDIRATSLGEPSHYERYDGEIWMKIMLSFKPTPKVGGFNGGMDWTLRDLPHGLSVHGLLSPALMAYSRDPSGQPPGPGCLSRFRSQTEEASC